MKFNQIDCFLNTDSQPGYAKLECGVMWLHIPGLRNRYSRIDDPSLWPYK
jgi:hypothetical protein